MRPDDRTMGQVGATARAPERAQSSAVLNRLGDVGFCVELLEELGATVQSVEILRAPLTPLILLAQPGRIEQALDVLQQRHYCAGRARWAEVYGCVVAWSAVASADG